MPSTDIDGSPLLILSVAEAAVVKEALDIHHCDFWQPTDPDKAAVARQIIRKIEDVEAYQKKNLAASENARAFHIKTTGVDPYEH